MTIKQLLDHLLHGLVFFVAFHLALRVLPFLSSGLVDDGDPYTSYSFFVYIMSIFGIFPSIAYAINLPVIAFENYKRKIWHSMMLGLMVSGVYLIHGMNPLIHFVLLISLPIFIPTICLFLCSRIANNKLSKK